MTSRGKVIAPILVLVAGALAAVVVVAARPRAVQKPRSAPAPLVRAMVVQSEDVQLVVRTHGTVAPRNEIDVVPEISGRVVELAPFMNAGGFFDEGAVLLRLDARDYELAVTSAEAAVAQARVGVAREEAEAEVAQREWKQLSDGEAPPLVLREPQLTEARAQLAAALANLDKARLDLSRTTIFAPFAGRVREENVDLGQFLTRGEAIARIYSVDVAEVRLPLPDDQLAYLDLPLAYRATDGPLGGPEVRLSADFAGARHTWHGRIVRTEGEVDARSRMVHAIAQVDDPYGRRGGTDGAPPLAVGLFVDADVMGRVADDVYVLPRVALRGRDRVLVVDDDDRLRFRDVDVLRFENERVLIRSGLAGGERVCISPLEVAVDGMQVRAILHGEDDAPAGREDDGALFDRPASAPDPSAEERSRS